MNCYRPHSPVTMVPLRFSMKREAPNVFQEQNISCLVTPTSWIALSTTRPDNGEKNNVEGGCVMEEKTGKQIRRQGGGGGVGWQPNRCGHLHCGGAVGDRFFAARHTFPPVVSITGSHSNDAPPPPKTQPNPERKTR